MKGPFYAKTKQNRCAVIEPCRDCTFCKNDTICVLEDCPFYFTDYEKTTKLKRRVKKNEIR